MAGLEDLYREIILDHYRAPRNRGELPAPPALKVEGFNPLCGDEIAISTAVEDHLLTMTLQFGQPLLLGAVGAHRVDPARRVREAARRARP